MYYVIALLCIAVLSHLPRFDLGNTLFFWDFWIWSSDFVNSISAWNLWAWLNYTSLGGPNLQLWFNLHWILRDILWSFDIWSKLTLLIPIAIFWFLSPYFLIQYIIKNKSISFIGALIYGSAVYFIVKQTAHINIALVHSIAPLILMLFVKLLQNPKLNILLFFNFVFFIGVCSEIRIMFLVSIILFLALIFFVRKNNYKILIKYFLISVIIQLGVNAFWLIPTLIWSGGAIEGTTWRDLFWSYLFSLLNAFTGFESSWTWQVPNQHFFPQTIPYYLRIFPSITVLSCLFYKNYSKDHKKWFFFSLVVALFWILLSKQEAAPWTKLYRWLYLNIPWFNLFREASKYYFFVDLAYPILISIFLNILTKYKKSLLIVVLFIICCLNLYPLFSGKIWTLWDKRIETEVYKNINHLIRSDKWLYKTLWIPFASQWWYFNYDKPRIWIDSIFLTHLSWHYQNNDIDWNNFSSWITSGISNEILDVMGVKYVIVPDRDEWGDNYIYYWGEPLDYLRQVQKIKGLTQLKINGEIQPIFKNDSYLSIIFTTDQVPMIWNLSRIKMQSLDVKIVSASKYHFVLKNISKVNLIFSQTFDNNWSIYDNGIDFLTPIRDKWYFSNTHVKSFLWFNQRTLDADYIKKNFPKDYYKENPDGSIDINLTLYFRPQSYFYLWLGVSGLTFLWLITWLLVDRRRQKNLVQQISAWTKNQL